MVELVQAYTKEAGVRNLEREIANIMRKTARQVAEGRKRKTVVDVKKLEEHLGAPRFEYGELEAEDQTGAATGLVVTEVGGDVISVEVTKMPGKEDFILTGQLGEVMRESARAGLSWIRAHADELGIEREVFEKNTLHIHVPAGGIPKDGPSAGITMALAMVSAFTGIPVRKDVAMTGEITLRGRVLPIGGLKSKILGAHLAGAKTIILPMKNQKDLTDIPEEIRKQMKLVLVDTMDQVLEHGLVRLPKRLEAKPAEVVEKGEPLDEDRRPRRTRSAGVSPAPTSRRQSQRQLRATRSAERRRAQLRPKWSTGTTTPRSACRARRARPTSRKPSASSPGSTIRTSTRATPTPSSASRRSARPTRSSLIRRSASSTTSWAQLAGVPERRRRAAARPGQTLRRLRRLQPGPAAGCPLRVPRHRGRSGRLFDFFRTFFSAAVRTWTIRARGTRTQTRVRTGSIEELLARWAAVRQRDGLLRRARAARPRAEAEAEVTLDEVATGTKRLLDIDGKRLEVNIPAGVSDGQRIRFSGVTTAIDAYVKVKVKPHRGLHARRRRPASRTAALAARGAARRRGPGRTLTGRVMLAHPARDAERQIVSPDRTGLPHFRRTAAATCTRRSGWCCRRVFRMKPGRPPSIPRPRGPKQG